MIKLIFSLLLLLISTKIEHPNFILEPIIGKRRSFIFKGIKNGVLIGEKFRIETKKVEYIEAKVPTKKLYNGIYIFLTSGDIIPSRKILNGSSEEIYVSCMFGKAVKIPVDVIKAIVFSIKGKTLKTEDIIGINTDTDIIFLKKEEKTIKIPVTITRINKNSVEFEFGSSTREIDLKKIQGILFASANKNTEIPENYSEITTLYGGKLTGIINGTKNQRITFNHPNLGLIKIPLNRIKRINFSYGRTIYLTNMKPVEDIAEPSFSRVWPYSINKTINGNPLKIGSKIYKNGFCFLPKRKLVFKVPDGFNVFKAIIGIDAETNGKGKALFEIYVDNNKIFEKLITGKSPETKVSLYIGKAKRISISADFGPDLDIGDHCDFINPRLIKTTWSIK